MTKAVLIAVGLFIVVVAILAAWRTKSRIGAAGRDPEPGTDNLLQHRVVLLEGVVSDETAKVVIAKMLLLQHQDPGPPIHLWVDPEGGSVVAGLAILDTMKEIRPPVWTLCRGRAQGITAVIVANGRKGHRQAQEKTQLSITPPVWDDEHITDETAMHRLLQDLVTAVAEQTGQPEEIVQEDFKRGREFDVRGAKGYGLIDGVADGGG
jgi:ATP-dependent Clp protease protease subunit